MPYELFKIWAHESGTLYAGLSTVKLDGAPNARTVKVDEKFTFSTHAWSDKVAEILNNPRVTLLFRFTSNARQVVVSGQARIHTAVESQQIWDERSESANVTSWRNHVGVNGGGSHCNKVPSPELSSVMSPYFCPVVVEPTSFEFSEQQPDSYIRDRILYTRIDGGAWTMKRLVYSAAVL